MQESITYTSYEAARILQVDESTIRRRCMAGKLIGAYRGVLRSREIWMIPAAALGLGEEREEKLPNALPGYLETDQPGDSRQGTGQM